MRIHSIVPKPEDQCVEPTLVLDVVVAFQSGQRMPLDLAVEVRTEDKKLLGVARPITMMPSEKLAFKACEPGDNNEISVPVRVVLGLSPKQLDYLEGLRSKHRKGDVILHCRVEAQSLVSKTVIATMYPTGNGASGSDQPVVYRQTNRDFYSQFTNMWVLSANGNRTFMELETLRFATTVTIGSGDWLHDYSSPWRTTRYLVVELPQPEFLTSAPNIEQRVNAAIDAAKRSADNIAKGEWNDALEDLRPVWELLRKQSDISDLFQRDGYTADAITAVDEIVRHQFTLASKFLHRVDQSGKQINPEIRASKEDALVCYACAMSLLNLVSRKSARLR